jgi:hypothetical protein
MILELPAHPVPIKLRVSYINYRLQLLEAHDLENCLPRLLLQQHNFTSLIYPFRIVSSTPSQLDDFTNISFFDCSPLRQHHLTDHYSYYANYEHVQQDMISCPIYVAAFDEDVVELNLVSCTKLPERDLPLILPGDSVYGIQQNSMFLSWSETNLDKECLECKHKSKKKTITIILSSAGEITSLLYFILFDFGVGSDFRRNFFIMRLRIFFKDIE